MWHQLLLVCFMTQPWTGEMAKCNFTSWEEYIKVWQTRFFGDYPTMYPYGEVFCDTNATVSERNMGLDPKIPFEVHYSGVVYKSAWVLTDGAVLLNTTESPPTTVYIFKESWPNDQFPYAVDPPILFSFYSKSDFRIMSSNERSRLSYRVLDTSDNSQSPAEIEIAREMLVFISEDVNRNVVGAQEFSAEYGLIVTWYEVTFGGAACRNGANGDNCVRNTYQLALVVSGESTHVVMNYLDINWVGSAGDQRCDWETGVKSSRAPDCSPAFIGFNAGFGRYFKPLPYSNDPDRTQDIDVLGGSATPGRFYYKISGDRIVRGGCTNDTALDNDLWPLEVSPRHVPMTGGHALMVSGPCFHKFSSDHINCRFGSTVREIIIDDEQSMSLALCIPPILNIVGNMKLELSLDGGATYPFHQFITVNLVEQTPPAVQVDSSGDWVNPEEVVITWTPDDLGSSTTHVNIVLVGYREYQDEHRNWQLEWAELTSEKFKAENTGRYAVHVPSTQCQSTEVMKCEDFRVGVVQVRNHRDDPLPPRALSSAPIPTTWFTKTELQAVYGADWPSALCKEWGYIEQDKGHWSDEDLLPACPCTYQQALVDFGRFQPDLLCSVQNKQQENCVYHSGAKHCMVSTFVSDKHGSGTRCCYDAKDALLYAQDTAEGSHSDRSHPWGQSTNQRPPFVPTMSHWVADVLPWYYCCHWQEFSRDCTNKYLQNRRTRDCVSYSSPGHAIVFGDPHLITPDGTLFTFNGFGEFWLLLVQDVKIQEHFIDFQLQGRFQQPFPHIWETDVQATMLTAVSMQLVDKSTVQPAAHVVSLVVDHFYTTSKNKILVLVNDELLNFDSHETYRQQFYDFIIVNHDPAEDKISSNFTVAYKFGMGVHVSFSNGLLQCTVSLPPELKGQTKGLFGLWNDVAFDDLVPKDSIDNSPVNPNDTSAVHYDFGLTWMVAGSTSLFTNIYRARLDYNFYNRPDFLPVFDPVAPQREVSRFARAADFCGDSETCRYDYLVMQSEEVARDTLLLERWFHNIRQLAAPVATCGLLDVPNSMKQQPVSYLVGSTVIITGCVQGFQLRGPTSYTCETDGSSVYWSPAPSTRCIDMEKQWPIWLIVLVAIAAGLAFIILLILVLCCIRCCCQRKKNKEKKRRHEEDMMQATLQSKPKQSIQPGQYYLVAPHNVDVDDLRKNPEKKKKSKNKKKSKADAKKKNLDNSEDESFIENEEEVRPAAKARKKKKKPSQKKVETESESSTDDDIPPKQPSESNTSETFEDSYQGHEVQALPSKLPFGSYVVKYDKKRPPLVTPQNGHNAKSSPRPLETSSPAGMSLRSTRTQTTSISPYDNSSISPSSTLSNSRQPVSRENPARAVPHSHSRGNYNMHSSQSRNAANKPPGSSHPKKQEIKDRYRKENVTNQTWDKKRSQPPYEVNQMRGTFKSEGQTGDVLNSTYRPNRPQNRVL